MVNKAAAVAERAYMQMEEDTVAPRRIRIAIGNEAARASSRPLSDAWRA